MKFSNIVKKVAAFWENPAHATLTEPFNLIGRATYAVIEPFLEGIDDARNYGDRGAPIIRDILSNWMDGGMVTGMTTLFGGIAGAAGGGFLAGAAAYSAAGGSIALTTLAGIAGLGIGAVVTPFIAVGVFALAGAAIGTAAFPYGLAKGCVIAYRHYKDQKAQGAAVAAVPALQAKGPDAAQKAADLFETLRGLDPEVQAPVLKALNDRFAASASGAANKIIKAIDVLPEEERKALVQDLRGRLAETFEKVAVAEAEDATQLQRRIKPLEPIRFSPKPKAKAG